MKRRLMDSIGLELPSSMQRLIEGARIYDSSCSPDAKVYFIDKGDGYYLKTSSRESLAREYEMTKYFYKKGLCANVIEYLTFDGCDFMLTERVLGEDCTYQKYLDDPRRLCDIIATRLRELHELDASDCPVSGLTAEYILRAEDNYRTGNYDSSHFPDSFGYSSSEKAYSALQGGKGALCDEVLIHGDYCLPNIMLDEWIFSGFIDLGASGIGDRHVDLFWGAWTLAFNLGTDQYKERFFDAYGRDKIDKEKLRTVAAAEVFG